MSRCVCFMMILASLAIGRADAVLKDAHLLPIDKETLVAHIRETPLASPEHDRLIVRAYSSGLFETAYAEYTRLQERHPDSARANYLRGVVALTYGFVGGVRGLIPPGSPLEPHLMQVAHVCLKRAIALDPRLARANSVYGYVLWQWDHDFARGLRYLKKAVAQAPNDPAVHNWLAIIYLNPSGKDFDAARGVEEARTAIRLDRAYVPPHFLLEGYYQGILRYEEAKREHRAWLDLLPPGAAEDKVVRIY